MTVKISDIAKTAGVSTMVVSRVIKGVESVKKPDRIKVQRAIARLGYQSPSMKGVPKQTNKVFALIIPRFEDIFHSFYASEVIKGVGLAASRLKVDILIHISDRYVHEDWLKSSLMDLKYIDGIIFADINGDRATLKKVIARNIPCMVMNNYFQEAINCIAIDNKNAAINVMEYLIDLGHTKIATIAGDLNTQAGKDRLDGYKETLKKHEIKIKDEYITTGDFLRTPAREAAKKLLSLSDRPTAIFAASDVMAMEAQDVAKQQGLKVPDDVSIIGFDDNPLAEYSPVPLTTVSQPIVEMGRLAIEILNQIILNKQTAPVKKLLPTKLIKRDSCKKL